MLTEIQNNVSLEEAFQPEVAVLAIGFPQLLQWEACVGRLKPTQSLRGYIQRKAITDQRLAERSHMIIFLHSHFISICSHNIVEPHDNRMNFSRLFCHQIVILLGSFGASERANGPGIASN